MDPLQYDPRTKQNIKDVIYGILYEPVQKEFRGRIEDLIRRNCLYGNFTHRSLIYKGVVYQSLIEKTAAPIQKNRLVPQLRQEMDEYLEDLTELNEKELPRVLGYINQVLNSSEGLVDYLKLLPEAVHYPLERLIENCPCKGQELSAERIEALRLKNQESFDLMRTRMAHNLLL